MMVARYAERPHWSRLTVLAAATLVAAACGQGPIPIASPSPSAPSPAQASISTVPPHADRIRIGIVSPYPLPGDTTGTSPFPLSNVIDHQADSEALPVADMIFRALYRYDAVLTPVPDLTTELCSTSSDLLQLTCHLGSARFSNGDPVTAEDVAFTYNLGRSDVCPFGQLTQICLKDYLKAADVLDPSTVRFTLDHVDPTFASLLLPNVWIDSKALVESQYQAFRSAAAVLGSARLRSKAEALDGALGKANPDCDALRLAAEPLVTSAGVQLPDKALWNIGPGRSFDTCAWAGWLRDTLSTAADSLDATGVDAEAIAYSLLPLNWHPVGSGLWQMDEAATKPGERVVLTPSPTADHQPATPRFDFVSYPTRRDAAAGFQANEIDWLYIPADWGGGVEQGGADLYHLVQGFADVKFAEYADPTGLMELDLNIHKGELFADPNLRHALALCMDKGPLVDAATDGQGTQAATVIAPDFWPANPELQVPERDVAAARSLIESSGWRLKNGVYQKDGKSLAAEMWVAVERPERVKFANLLAFQLSDCGIRLTVRSGSGSVINGAIYGWPNVPPGRKQAFQMIMAFGFAPLDPDPYLSYFLSSNAGSAENKYGDASGYLSAAYDQLVVQARQSYDTDKRARLYREAQALLAADLPTIPIWYRLNRVALRSGLTTSTGSPLDLRQPGWNWRMDELILTTSGQ